MITSRVLVCLFFLYCPFSSAELTKAYEIALDRAVYSDALYALKNGDKRKFSRLRQELVDKEYPLVIYLDYRKISGSLSRLNLEKAKKDFRILRIRLSKSDFGEVIWIGWGELNGGITS